MNIIAKSKFHLIFNVLPLVIVAAGIKTAVYYCGWAIIPKDMTSFFPSIFTGIIFILGFILAGVLSDYKESEKIPNDISSSLYILWQETYIACKNFQNPSSKTLQDKIKRFFPMFKNDFLVARGRNIFYLVDSFSDDFSELDKNVAPPLMGRLRTEQANIRKILNRIEVIKDTDFVPSVFVSIKAISALFLLMYCFLQVDQNNWWGGTILISIFTFIIFSIIFLISDMDDPFEYNSEDTSNVKSDEISLAVLQKFHDGILNK